jgi:RNA polymerase sigma factor (TIGR02999 family)
VNSCVSEPFIGLPASSDVALTELTPTLYSDLRRIAWRHLNWERRNHTLQATALVHEAYLKLAGTRERRFTDDGHFLAVASRAMRQVLVDYARSRATQKRDGKSNEDALAETTVYVNGERGPEIIDLIALDDALAALASEDERLARLIEMRYFGGMTAEDSARELGISPHIVRHDLRFAHAWLRRKLSSARPKAGTATASRGIASNMCLS